MGKLSLLTDVNYMVMICANLNSKKEHVHSEGAYLKYYNGLGKKKDLLHDEHGLHAPQSRKRITPRSRG